MPMFVMHTLELFLVGRGSRRILCVTGSKWYTSVLVLIVKQDPTNTVGLLIISVNNTI